MVATLVAAPAPGSPDTTIRSDVLSGIRRASLSTGVDFSYLMAQANRESSFDPTAQAKTSSAAGLYQFVEQTWFGVVKHHGAEYGRGDLAEKIIRNADGRFSVADGSVRKIILDLRRDPGFAAAMAAEHAADNKSKLENRLGREINGTDLYMAHFLGISGALKFLRSLADSPERTGASMFPKAAAVNEDVFYTQGGRARTVAEIYDRFSDSMDADMEAYAAFEQPGEFAVKLADAGSSMPLNPDAAYPSAFRYASAGSGGTTVAALIPESNRLGGIGSLLSPLLLVTLAALPVGQDESSKDRDDRKDHRTGHGVLAPGNGGNSLFGRSEDPLHLELLRSSYAT